MIARNVVRSEPVVCIRESGLSEAQVRFLLSAPYDWSMALETFREDQLGRTPQDVTPPHSFRVKRVSCGARGSNET